MFLSAKNVEKGSDAYNYVKAKRDKKNSNRKITIQIYVSQRPAVHLLLTDYKTPQ